jgi:hypothetical protein
VTSPHRAIQANLSGSMRRGTGLNLPNPGPLGGASPAGMATSGAGGR